MIRKFLWRLLPVLWLVLGFQAIAWAQEPAIVLTAFGTTTAAADTYRYIEEKVRARFPGHEIRWAFTSNKVRRKVAAEQGKELKTLPQALKELQVAGYQSVAVQSLHVVPGKEWDEVVQASRQVPGLKVALGQPLLNAKPDEERVLAALSKTFPADLKNTAVVLVGHGTPNSRAQRTYLDFDQLLRARYPGQNVYLGVVQVGQPSQDETLAAVKLGGAAMVRLVPFLLVAGEHVNNDILGDGPESWKSKLVAQGISRVEGVRRGLGYNDDIIKVYLDHLEIALKDLEVRK
ncbi:MAG: sirohydrochlorin cobaltochelatase [Deltaproteobacteria bacterium]|nr:sirohydrochlorin cobaltochelatase [Deltaproteobacteria bacterium]